VRLRCGQRRHEALDGALSATWPNLKDFTPTLASLARHRDIVLRLRCETQELLAATQDTLAGRGRLSPRLMLCSLATPRERAACGRRTDWRVGSPLARAGGAPESGVLALRYERPRLASGDGICLYVGNPVPQRRN
jgi:hypothetical protein